MNSGIWILLPGSARRALTLGKVEILQPASEFIILCHEKKILLQPSQRVQNRSVCA